MTLSYTLSYGPKNTGPWTQYATGLTVLTDTINGLTAATDYYVMMTAVDSVTGLVSPAAVAGPFETASASLVESADGTLVTTPYTASNILMEGMHALYNWFAT